MTAIQLRCVLPITLGVVLLLGCDCSLAPDGGSYRAVTPEKLTGSTSSQRTGQHDFEFTWTFDATSFVIEGNAIPSDLITAMLGPDVKATKIEGAWEIRDGIICFVVGTEDKVPARECSMRIYSTGPIRIESSEAQYVF
ncbi:hypothetical protein N9B17_01245 [Rhodopirellula sp.]|nr:hypothetical protein [Rhodopirellula sp.]